MGLLTASVEWLTFWAYVLVMCATLLAYRDVKRDAEAGARARSLTEAERRHIQPIADLAVTHERLRLLTQFVGFVASAVCVALPTETGREVQVLRAALLVFCGLMLLTTLHSLRVRRTYFRAVRQMDAAERRLRRDLARIVRKETA